MTADFGPLRSLGRLIEEVPFGRACTGVALGSGSDSFAIPIAVDQLPYLTQALLLSGLDVAAIKAAMGENAIRFLLQDLPQDRTSRT